MYIKIYFRKVRIQIRQVVGCPTNEKLQKIEKITKKILISVILSLLIKTKDLDMNSFNNKKKDRRFWSNFQRCYSTTRNFYHRDLQLREQKRQSDFVF